MGDDVVSKVLRYYGIRPQRLLAMQKGYRNESHPVELASGERLNLILYKSEPGIAERIQRANRVADFLAAQGFPARATADPRIAQLRSGQRVKYGALYTYLPGATIPWEAYTMEHLKALGHMMSDMHTALATLSTGNLPAVAAEYEQIVARMERYFSESGVQQALQKKLQILVSPTILAHFGRLLKKTKQLPSQVLHMDFVRGNILFEKEQPVICGILDFEKTAYGPASFDIARTLAFLLVDCKYKPSDKVRKYFLQSGYNKRGRAHYQDMAVRQTGQGLLDELVTLFLFYDFYKFLRHNPYEYLHQNEHFVRTRDALVARGSIVPTTRLA